MHNSKRTARSSRKNRRAGKILIMLLVVVITLAAVMYIVYKLGVRPPDMKDWIPPGSGSSAEPTEEAEAVPGTVFTDRKGTQYTFAVLGMDDGNCNTDTIMVANFDADNHKLNILNIPRDTLVNVKWNTKKVNTLFANGGIESVKKGLSDLGIHVDFYVKVDLKAFSTLVDAIDGVYFDVLKDMHYEDPAQNLYIHLDAGPQLLDGAKALQLVRCRNAYANADIGRIETQQAFLKAAAEQILANQKKLDITELARIFVNDVTTDLDLGEVIWLGKEFLKTDAANISFSMIPANYYDTVHNTSYCTINVSEWLQLLNEKINPFKDEIKASEVSILTRGEDGVLYVTNGVWAGKKSWGSGGSSSASGGGTASPSPKPSASPSPGPKQNPDPSPSTSTDPGDEPPSPSVGDSSTDIRPSEPGDPSPSTPPSPPPDDSASPSPVLDGNTPPEPIPDDSAPPSHGSS
ncbi:MAG: LCP family protein [Clostridiales bacterium]|nr:LCP family protein [Clostridiales bacterium]